MIQRDRKRVRHLDVDVRVAVQDGSSGDGHGPADVVFDRRPVRNPESSIGSRLIHGPGVEPPGSIVALDDSDALYVRPEYDSPAELGVDLLIVQPEAERRLVIQLVRDRWVDVVGPNVRLDCLEPAHPGGVVLRFQAKWDAYADAKLPIFREVHRKVDIRNL